MDWPFASEPGVPMRERSKRRLAAILAADIAGYSRLVDRDEEGTVAALRAHLKAILPIIAEHSGHVVDTAGDGILAEFPSAVRATEAAIAVQRRMDELGAATPEKERLRFRIGINVGDVIAEGANIFGDGVNVAARLEQLAEPGQILVAGTAFDQLRGKIDLPLDFAGEQLVKNISVPVRTYSVRTSEARRTWWLRARQARRYLSLIVGLVALAIVSAAAWWLQPRDAGLASKPSLAVLPFENIGGDADAGRFADGLTEDIITDLARYRELDVIARNSTGIYKGKPIDIRQVGRDLNVRYVLEGSVQRQANQIRVTSQLIEVGAGAHLWSERWDRPLGDFFAVQTEIAAQVTARLVDTKGAMLLAEPVARRRANPTDMTAYELFLRGQEAVHKFTKEGAAEAIPLFKLAIDKEPSLARAWVALAAAFTILSDFGAEPAASRVNAFKAAQRATELDPMDSIAHALLATQIGTQGDFQRAQSEFETALRLTPGSADVMSMYSAWLVTFGQPQRAAELVDRVIRLDPDFPAWMTGPFSYSYVMAGRYGDALRVLERQSTDNYTPYSYVHRAVANAVLGDQSKAKIWVSKALDRYPDLTIEGHISDPGLSDMERRRLTEMMRKAGFPACARPEQLKEFANPTHLPECTGQPKPQ